MDLMVDLNYEKKFAEQNGYKVMAGMDEVGRGPLAGPVTVAVFVFLKKIDTEKLKFLRDSKLLSENQRSRMYEFFCELKKQGKADFASASCFPATIDKYHISEASVLAMRRAVKKLSTSVDHVFVDKFPYAGRVLTDTSYTAVKGADNLIPSVAAASIVAKVRRDRSMANYYHRKYPEYGFDLHKGYGTAMHYKALKKHGPSPAHRQSFRLA
ncbi:MAG: ribonuclease HII [Candidatus Spechtbacterales bacterium]